MPTCIQAVPTANAMGCEFQIPTPSNIKACNQLGVPLAIGATTLFAKPSGIDAWNCKIPSISQIAPNPIRRYVRLRGSLRPAGDRLNVPTLRIMAATMNRARKMAMIQFTAVT